MDIKKIELLISIVKKEIHQEFPVYPMTGNRLKQTDHKIKLWMLPLVINIGFFKVNCWGLTIVRLTIDWSFYESSNQLRVIIHCLDKGIVTTKTHIYTPSHTLHTNQPSSYHWCGSGWEVIKLKNYQNWTGNVFSLRLLHPLYFSDIYQCTALTPHAWELFRPRSQNKLILCQK